MALYIVKLTVPPNTSEYNPIEEKVTVEGKMLEKIEYRFPAGCFETVKVNVQYGNRRISPKGKVKYVDGEDEKIEDPVEWDLPARRTTLTIVGWSEAEDFEHTVTVRLIVRPYRKEELLAPITHMLRAILDRVRMLLGV